MILSERGAINSAISDGGFHLYPAGKIVEIIKKELSQDNLSGNFDPKTTVEKISRVNGPSDTDSRELFKADLKILCDRLSQMDTDYNIEKVFDKMMESVPALAKRYYGINDFVAPRPKVVEYFFEGYNDLYKDGDWYAFNVNHTESREMNVPYGTYFKRSQMSPGQPEYISFHEANHAMQESTLNPEGYHYYVPWLDEGMADIFARMMLFRATGDEAMMQKIKNFRTEIDVTDERKITYHFGEQVMALILLRGRLPFLKALMHTFKKDPFSVDWNEFVREIRAGWDPHIAIVSAYRGKNQDTFRKKLEREETAFRKDGDLDQMDLKILGMFLATQPPACLTPKEYRAALWLNDAVTKRPSPYSVDPQIIPANFRSHIPNWSENNLVLASSIPADAWKKAPEIDVKIEIREDEIPSEFKEGTASLASKYFIIKRQIGDAIVFEPYGGGLPYRLGTGEVRCAY